MNRLNVLLLVIFSVLVLGCKSEQKQNGEETSVDKTEETKIAEVPRQEPTVLTDLTPLPEEVFKKVYNESDHMDGIFENLPFSMSQETNASIQQVLTHVDKKAPEQVSSSCPLFAQQIYQKAGNVIMEADVYCSEGCHYYVFKHEGKKYYNAMMPAGVTFYENLKTQNFQVPDQMPK